MNDAYERNPIDGDSIELGGQYAEEIPIVIGKGGKEMAEVFAWART